MQDAGGGMCQVAGTAPYLRHAAVLALIFMVCAWAGHK